MHCAFTPPLGLTIALGALGAVLFALLPTGLYLYVEPRCRLTWGALGDTPRTRRAPGIVRLAAWWSFAVGQLAVLALAVPASCVVLFYLQAKLGVIRPIGALATGLAAVLALAQSVLALRLFPLGVRLLARDERLAARVGAVARTQGLASACGLGVAALLHWGLLAVPGLVHPWLRAALDWTALRPMLVYAALGLLHAALLGSCARAFAVSRPPQR